MTKTRIDEWIKVCKRMLEEYSKGNQLISIAGCPLCDVVDTYVDCDNCLWEMFERKSCIGNVEKGYKNRIPRLERWIKRLEKMKEEK